MWCSYTKSADPKTTVKITKESKLFQPWEKEDSDGTVTQPVNQNKGKIFTMEFKSLASLWSNYPEKIFLLQF